MSLLEGMIKNKGHKKLTLYWDIETLTYNKFEGQDKPTKYKSVVYSVAIGWYDEGLINVEVFPSFKAFYDAFFSYAKRQDTINKSETVIEMIAHNCNKYDNHFLLHDTMMLFSDIKRYNMYMSMAEDNDHALTMKLAKKASQSENIILEKRVKSSINLDMTMILYGFRFNIIDNYMKTHTSIATLGKKLNDGGYISSEHLKTDFDYQAFDVNEDMTEVQAHRYARQCFKKLNDAQMTYIKNDVIILGMCHVHYSDIFPTFDYSKMTFSVNVLESYLNNEMTRFQLLNKYQDIKLSYTDYTFFDMNLYDYIKGFYRGGLNMYNPNYLAQIIDEPCFSIDLNSSYPYVMYNEKIPTYLSDYGEYEDEKTVRTDLDNYDQYTLYKVGKRTFNQRVIRRIESEVVRKIIVKYYNNERDYVNINTNTLRIIELLTGLDLSEIDVMSYLTYDCTYFGARDMIHQNYFIKSQGKLDYVLEMPSPFDYHITNQRNEVVYSKDEILLSKTLLNGLYGIPALRSHFNLFRINEDDALYNVINGYKNTERNLLFSTFVTSQAFYNLLEPLSYLEQAEIDDCFVYCDTDSLYLKSKIKDKLPSDLFDPIALGAWDVENDYIEKMYVLNHKKYAYLSDNEIHVACAGVPQEAFHLNQSFDDFIKNDFHDGAVVYNQKSIYNEQGTISIYPSKTYMDKGLMYQSQFNDYIDNQRERVIESAREDILDDDSDHAIYIESEIGSFSVSDVFPVHHSIHQTTNINSLKMTHDLIKNS